MTAIHRYSKDTGNKVSRRATISGPQNIILGGKTIISNGAIIRGDLKRAGPGHAVVISLGRYCLVGEGCVMRWVSPPQTTLSKSPRFVQAALQDLPRRVQLLPDEDR
jgi:carbonic anhydrase/acetyltransferase-like protein (isoleucine patch superfamily)